MKPTSSFWTVFKTIVLLLLTFSVAAAVYSFFSLEGLRRTFFTVCCGLLALNFFAIYYFIRLNTGKRTPRR